MPEIDELSFSECQALLRAGVFGRMAVSAQDGPLLVPVNYSVSDAAIIIRTAGRRSGRADEHPRGVGAHALGERRALPGPQAAVEGGLGTPARFRLEPDVRASSPPSPLTAWR